MTTNLHNAEKPDKQDQKKKTFNKNQGASDRHDGISCEAEGRRERGSFSSGQKNVPHAITIIYCFRQVGGRGEAENINTL